MSKDNFESVTFTTSPEVAAKLEAAAAELNISVNTLVNAILWHYCKKQQEAGR